MTPKLKPTKKIRNTKNEEKFKMNQNEDNPKI